MTILLHHVPKGKMRAIYRTCGAICGVDSNMRLKEICRAKGKLERPAD